MNHARTMLNRIRRARSRCALAAAALWVITPSQAQTPPPNPPATVMGPIRDPWVPPELRKPPATPPAQGAELRAQVERKLKASFDAAAGSAGTLSREQASAAGLGLIAKHFDEIDQGKTGSVRFDDVKRYLRQRGAQLD
jgi:hypothetical protein